MEKDNKTSQDQKIDFTEKMKNIRKITDPVKKAEESCRITDEMCAAKQQRLRNRLGVFYFFYELWKRIFNRKRRSIRHFY